MVACVLGNLLALVWVTNESVELDPFLDPYRETVSGIVAGPFGERDRPGFAAGVQLGIQARTTPSMGSVVLQLVEVSGAINRWRYRSLYTAADQLGAIRGKLEAPDPATMGLIFLGLVGLVIAKFLRK